MQTANSCAPPATSPPAPATGPERYLAELTSINAAHRGGAGQGFRTRDVICVDNNGTTFTFSDPQDIAPTMNIVLDVFAAEFDLAENARALAVTFARFYYAFIAVHPYRNANGRTVTTFLQRRAREKSFDLASAHLLKRVALHGDVTAEMQRLIALFTHVLKPQARGAEHDT